MIEEGELAGTLFMSLVVGMLYLAIGAGPVTAMQCSAAVLAGGAIRWVLRWIVRGRW